MLKNTRWPINLLWLALIWVSSSGYSQHSENQRESTVPKNRAQSFPLQNPMITPLQDDYQLEEVRIGGGGYITGIHIHPSVPNLLWTRSDMSGPWKKAPGSSRWFHSILGAEYIDPPSDAAAGVAIHPQNPNILYAALGSGRFHMGMYKTTDGGKRWKRVHSLYVHANEGEARLWGNCIAIDPHQPTILYWGTQRNGLWRSTDEGETWNRILSIDEGEKFPIRSVVVDPHQILDGRSQYVYAFQLGKGLWESRDGGETFTLMASIPNHPKQANWISIANDGTLCVSTERKVFRYHLQKGWFDITPPEGVQFYGIDIHPKDSQKIAVVGKVGDFRRDGKKRGWRRWTLFVSNDGGQNWLSPQVFGENAQSVATPIFNRDLLGLGAFCVTFDPHCPSRVYLGDCYTLWRCDDIFQESTTWIPEHDGIENIVHLTFASPPSPSSSSFSLPPLFSGVSDVRGFVHWNLFQPPSNYIELHGQEWATYVTGIDYCEQHPYVIWITKFGYGSDPQSGSKVLKSSDGGKTWTWVSHPLSGKSFGGAKIAVSATDPNCAVVFPGYGEGPVWTEDGGNTWNPGYIEGTSQRVPCIANRDSAYNFAFNGCADRNDGQIFYAYQYTGEEGIFWVSRNKGKTWRPTCVLPPANPHDDQSPVMVVSPPYRPKEVWIALGSAGLFRSVDNGETFQRVPVFAGSRPLLVAFGCPHPNQPSIPTLYVHGKATGTDTIQLHRSLDMGKTWQVIPSQYYQYFWQRGLIADRQTYGRIYFGGIGIQMLFINRKPPVIQGPREIQALVHQIQTVQLELSDEETDPSRCELIVDRISHPNLLQHVRLQRDPKIPKQWYLSFIPVELGQLKVELRGKDGFYKGAKSSIHEIQIEIVQPNP